MPRPSEPGVAGAYRHSVLVCACTGGVCLQAWCVVTGVVCAHRRGVCLQGVESTQKAALAETADCQATGREQRAGGGGGGREEEVEEGVAEG